MKENTLLKIRSFFSSLRETLRAGPASVLFTCICLVALVCYVCHSQLLNWQTAYLYTPSLYGVLFSGLGLVVVARLSTHPFFRRDICERIADILSFFLAVFFMLLLAHRVVLGATATPPHDADFLLRNTFGTSFVIASSFGLFFQSLFGSLRWGLVGTSLAFLFLGYATLIKITTLGDYARLPDLFLLGQTGGFLTAEMLTIWAPWCLVTFLFFGILFFGTLFSLVPSGKLTPRKNTVRWTLQFTVCGLLVLGCFFPNQLPDFCRRARAICLSDETNIWASPSFYAQTCPASYLFFSSSRPVLPVPTSYSEETVTEIIASHRSDEATTLEPSQEPPTSKPVNLIVILNESFCDATKLLQLGDSKKVLPCVSELRKKYPSLEVVPPEFGTATCHSELEVLTGMRTTLLPRGVYACYWVYRDFPSIARYLGDKGYETFAMLPEYETIWDWAKVAEKHGFGTVATCKDVDNKVRSGGRISDKTAVQELIRRIEVIKEEKKETPYFAYLLTTQNHSPFEGQSFLRKTYSPGCTGLDLRSVAPQNRVGLENYLASTSESDASLQLLIDYLEKDATEPTLVVFLGDHLPPLSALRAYAAEAKLDRNSLPVPMVVWANYELPDVFPKQQVINMSYVPVLTLDLLGQKLPPFLRFVKDFHTKYPVTTRKSASDQTGQTLPMKRFCESKDYLNYQMLQYDLFFGQQYAGKK